MCCANCFKLSFYSVGVMTGINRSDINVLIDHLRLKRATVPVNYSKSSENWSYLASTALPQPVTHSHTGDWAAAQSHAVIPTLLFSEESHNFFRLQSPFFFFYQNGLFLTLRKLSDLFFKKNLPWKKKKSVVLCWICYSQNNESNFQAQGPHSHILITGGPE